MRFEMLRTSYTKSVERFHALSVAANQIDDESLGDDDHQKFQRAFAVLGVFSD